MEVILARTAGFCMGVDLALRRLDKLVAAAEGRPIHILGPIIHNPQVLAKYAEQGVRIAAVPAEIPDGAYAVIRAHGITREAEQELRARNVIIKDATCPRVKKAQLLIARHTAGGEVLLLYGEADHPEVRGLVSYAGNGHHVFGSGEELARLPLLPGTPYVLAAQTTQDRAAFEAMAAGMEGDPALEVVVLHTICDATRLRQTETSQLAGQVDFMVVVGGLNSGNTRRLAQVAIERGTPSVHVETAADLDLASLRGHGRIGVTAGASTPRALIDEVLRALECMERPAGAREKGPGGPDGVPEADPGP